MSHTVYLITNTVTGRVYIGQTEDPVRRFRHHLNGNAGKLTDLAQYGRGAYAFELLSVHENREDALAEERRLIDHLGSEDPERGYNRPASGGAGLQNTNARARAVEQLAIDGSVITSFRSVKEASEITGAQRKCIERVCNGRQPATAGLRFRYA